LLNRMRRDGVDAVVESQENALGKGAAAPGPKKVASWSTQRSKEVRLDLVIPAAPDLELHTEEFDDLDAVFEWINPQMLFGKHLGFRGRVERAMEEGDPKLLDLVEQVDAVKRECREFLRPRAVWRWMEAEAQGNRIELFAAGQSVGGWQLPRAPRDEGHCLADYVLPPQAGGRDHLALFVATAGEGVLGRAQAAKEAGEYLRSHVLLALALETAEALSEVVHRQIRETWGIADAEPKSARELFQARYHGKRFSFGYPACPDLAAQRLLFDLLDPGRIGVTLTEGDMMDPEASVSALVFHHPDARYFDVGSVEVEEVG